MQQRAQQRNAIPTQNEIRRALGWFLK
jgi:hypothetical protein